MLLNCNKQVGVVGGNLIVLYDFDGQSIGVDSSAIAKERRSCAHSSIDRASQP